MSGGVWDVTLTQDEIDALAIGISPLLIRPDHLKEYVQPARAPKSGSKTIHDSRPKDP